MTPPVVIVCHALFVVCCSDFLSAGAPMTFNILKGNGKNFVAKSYFFVFAVFYQLLHVEILAYSVCIFQLLIDVNSILVETDQNVLIFYYINSF